MKTKRSVGRPKGSVKQDRMDTRYSVRCRTSDLKRWRKAAEKEGIGLMEWMRNAMDNAIK